MAVPIALGKTFFDPSDLKTEHNRLTRTLLHPSPRMFLDPAETLFFAIRDAGGEVVARHELYFKAFRDKASDTPTLRLFYKDSLNVERLFHDNGNNDAIAQNNALGAGHNLILGGVQYHAAGAGAPAAPGIDTATGVISAAGSDLGKVHYDAVGGLDLAVTNTRITEVNTALDGMTKVLTVLNGNIDAGISLIR